MESAPQLDREGARTAPEGQFTVLIHDAREEVLRGLLENPRFEEIHLCLLLGRKNLSSVLLESIAARTEWMQSYRVRRAIAFHPNAPHTLGLHLVRELYLPDLVQLTLSAFGQPALRHLAEELILARLPQLPLAKDQAEQMAREARQEQQIRDFLEENKAAGKLKLKEK